MHIAARRLVWGVLTLVSLQGRPVCAQSFVGTWVRQDTPMTMTVETCCGGGRRLTYHVPVNGNDVVMIVESALDGKDAPVMVGGKPSGQTMAIRQVDDHHATAVLKVNGQTYGTARGALSADGKTLVVEDEFTSAVAGQPVGKQTERWIRK
jgi:hypothetical protein